MMTLLRSAIKKANPNFKSSWLLPLDKHYNFQYQEYWITSLNEIIPKTEEKWNLVIMSIKIT